MRGCLKGWQYPMFLIRAMSKLANLKFCWVKGTYSPHPRTVRVISPLSLRDIWRPPLSLLESPSACSLWGAILKSCFRAVLKTSSVRAGLRLSAGKYRELAGDHMQVRE